MKKQNYTTSLTNNPFDENPQERGLRILGKIIARKILAEHSSPAPSLNVESLNPLARRKK